MGIIRHKAIVVTSWNAFAIEAAACRARNLGLTVMGPSGALINGYRTLLVCPDGSKEGFCDSDKCDERRAEFRAWMNEQRHDDGSSNLEWVEISYGSDDRKAEIKATAWNELMGVMPRRTDMPKQTMVIQCTPLEAGQQVWEKMVLPMLRAANGRPPKEVQQFYTGILMSCMGAMAADFGHARALEIMGTLVGSFAGMADELPGSRVQ